MLKIHPGPFRRKSIKRGDVLKKITDWTPDFKNLQTGHNFDKFLFEYRVYTMEISH